LDLNVAIALGVFGSFISIIGYKALKHWLAADTAKSTNSDKLAYETRILQLQKDFDGMENSRNGYRQKLGVLKKDYDLDFSDLELDDEGEPTKLIPTIVESMFGKLSPSVKAALGKDELLDGVLKHFTEQPENLQYWIDKFVPKKDSGSDTNTTQVLKSTYL